MPVATTVHNVQILDEFPWDPTDLPLSMIVTPEETVRVRRPPPAPKGIDWMRLTDDALDAMPVLKELRSLSRASKGKPRRPAKPQ